MDLVASIPCLYVNSYSNSEKPGSHYQPSIQFQYTHILILEMLTCTSVGNHLIKQRTVFVCSSFSLQSYRLCSFQKLFRSAVFTTTPSVRLFHTFIILIFSCHILHSILGFPYYLLYYLFSFEYIKACFVYCKFYGFRQMHNDVYS